MCTSATKLPGTDYKYAFGCSNGIVYLGRIFLADKLEITIEKELIAADENKHGIEEIIFGDYDGDGENEVGLLRQDNQIQIWQLFQNEPILRYQSKAEYKISHGINFCTEFCSFQIFGLDEKYRF